MGSEEEKGRAGVTNLRRRDEDRLQQDLGCAPEEKTIISLARLRREAPTFASRGSAVKGDFGLARFRACGFSGVLAKTYLIE